MIRVFDSVVVPEPNEGDIHCHGFVGSVVAVSGEFATVEDQDGDCFDIELNRLKGEK